MSANQPTTSGLVVVAGDADRELGGLPLLERAALHLHRAGIGTIAVVGARRDQLERLRRRIGPAAIVEQPPTTGTVMCTTSGAVLSRGVVPALLARGENAWVADSGRREDTVAVFSDDARAVTTALASPNPLEELARARCPIDLPGQLAARIDGVPIRALETRLLRSLRKDTDGPVSRHLNRYISLALTRYLARWGVHPNAITSFVLVLSLVAVALAVSASPAALAGAGLLFQIASIVDGCDGEVARLTFRTSRLGGFFDTVADNVRYGLFYGALGVALYRSSEASLYLWASAFFLLVTTFAFVQMGRFVLATQEHLSNLAVTALVEDRARRCAVRWERLLVALRVLVKQDVNALLCAVFLALGWVAPFFWAVVIGAAGMTVAVVRALKTSAAPRRRIPSPHAVQGLR